MSAPVKRPAPFSLRLNQAERAALERAAGSRSLSAYIKSRLFPNGVPESCAPIASAHWHKAGRSVEDHKALAQLLALLGASRLSQNVNQLAKAANCGTLGVAEDVETDLRAACTEIAAMRHLLLVALGMKPAVARS